MDKPQLEFFGAGLPRPAGSKRGFVVNGRVVIVDTCKRGKEWRKAVAEAAREAVKNDARFPLSGPVAVMFQFCLPRPQAHLQRDGLPRDSAPVTHYIRPDVLKLARAVEDALTGVVYKDDAQIVVELLSKEYAAPGGVPGVRVYVWRAQPGKRPW